MLAEASRNRALGAFEEAVQEAARLATDRRERVIAAATVEVEVTDPAAVAFGSRLASDEWFCWSEGERGLELATLGCASRSLGRGSDRFAEVASGCVEELQGAVTVARDADGDDISGRLPAGAGPVWVGGFAFDDHGGSTPRWSSFEPGSMTLPELSLLRDDGRTLLTACAAVAPDRPPDEILGPVAARLAGLREEPLPMLDPHPSARPSISSSHSPERFERAVAAALDRLRDPGDRLGKLVLAREITVSAAAAHDPAALFGAMRDGFPSCFCFCCGTREGAFLGASPELLVRRTGAGAVAVALAGSTRRSSDPALDDHLAERLLQSDKDRREHRIVADRIKQALEPHSVWVEAAEEPGIARVANIQHLATPIASRLRRSYSAIELAGLLHPTPAVGGEPWPEAADEVARLEDLDRGWYAGPIGWMDAAEDGEFCVALRSALLRDRHAYLYAGVGIVPGSEPSAELAETETKLGALLPLLAD